MRHVGVGDQLGPYEISDLLPRDRYAAAATLLKGLPYPPAAAERTIGRWRGRRSSSSRTAHRVVTIVIAAIVAGLGTLVWLGHAWPG